MSFTSSTNEMDDSDNEQNEVIPGYKTLQDFTKEGYKTLMEAIKMSNAIPSERDYNYYNTNAVFTKIMNDDGNSIIKLMNTVLRHYETDGNIRNRSLDEKTELIIQANDNILERVAINIDEMNGIRKTETDPIELQTVSAELPRINGSWNQISNLTVSVGMPIVQEKSKKEIIRLLTANNIIRPQTFFKDKVDNSSNPWEPRIKEKPNSLKPLAIFLEETGLGMEYSHPYQFELDHFEPMPEQLLKEEPVKPLPISETPLIEVTEPNQLDELVEVLRNCNEFAVDLEHHSYRTFMGITCLMQISTRTTDYIIDTLLLRDKLYVLNEVFTKPTIVKIFHGAYYDIQWLQRDLSLYVVNMFDTHEASVQLKFSGRSLAYLMNRYCNFAPNKQFQLADWRIRPLPDELKKYAREDTHYLIYIYHMMKNDLIEQNNGQTNMLKSVINESTELAKKRYFKPVFKEHGYMDFYRKCKRLFDNRQLYALKELYKWRDQQSREQDESVGYVLPNHMLLQIAETLPREMQGILACCNPIPPLVRANLLDLHKIVLKARERPLEKAILQEDTRARGSTKKMSKINVDGPLHCPHDLSKSNEFRDDLPVILAKTFLENNNILDTPLEIETSTSNCSIFNSEEDELIENVDEIQKKLKNITFLGPFERYNLVRPYIQEQEKKAAEAKAREEEEKRKQSAASQENSEDRSDEDRIEAIRDHFLTLSRLAVPVEGRSLIQMGGTKKRKREESQTDEDQVYTPEINLQTPVPRFHNTNKRKSCESYDDTQSKRQKFPKENQYSGKKFNKRKWPKKKGSNNQNHGDVSINNPQGEAQMSMQQTGDSTNNTTKQKKFKKKNRNKNKKTNQNQSQENPNDMGQDQEAFQSYDYSSIDFNQFQGGAAQASGQKFFKSKFKPKGKNRRGSNRGNRSGTFGTIRKGTEYGR